MTIFRSPSRSSGSGTDPCQKVITRDGYQEIGPDDGRLPFRNGSKDIDSSLTSLSDIVHYFQRYRNKSCAHRVNNKAPQSFCRDRINTIQYPQ